jgi:hypothetical protein
MRKYPILDPVSDNPPSSISWRKIFGTGLIGAIGICGLAFAINPPSEKPDITWFLTAFGGISLVSFLDLIRKRLGLRRGGGGFGGGGCGSGCGGGG